MVLAHLYQDFGSDQDTALSDASGQITEIGEEKLQSFEAGYQAGWDDCLKAQEDQKRQISANFAENLQNISFTYHEAHNALTKSLRPLFEEIFAKLLPEMARLSLGAHIVEQIVQMANDQGEHSIEIVVGPDSYEVLENTLEDQIQDPFTLQCQQDLEEGQAYIRIGSQEREINLDEIIRGIQESATALFGQEQKYG